ncbi:MAG: hypothetical protein JSR34_02125 [Proteobacteria bacterium]|nr:hypothetical protein [Pseudomonadota bacterium]
MASTISSTILDFIVAPSFVIRRRTMRRRAPIYRDGAVAHSRLLRNSLLVRSKDGSLTDLSRK